MSPFFSIFWWHVSASGLPLCEAYYFAPDSPPGWRYAKPGYVLRVAPFGAPSPPRMKMVYRADAMSHLQRVCTGQRR